jgi:phosphohistidine phosphatase
MAEITVHLLRHAHSSHAIPGERDHHRGLDERGRAEVEAIRLRLLRQPVGIVRIRCSTARRARLTLEPLLPVLGEVPLRYDDHLYAAGLEAYEAACVADGAASPVLVVGHNPTIASFVARYALQDGDAFRTGIKPATWITLRLGVDPSGRLGPGRLVTLIAPT